MNSSTSVLGANGRRIENQARLRGGDLRKHLPQRDRHVPGHIALLGTGHAAGVLDSALVFLNADDPLEAL